MQTINFKGGRVKKNIVLLLSLVFLFGGCKKEENETKEAIQSRSDARHSKVEHFANYDDYLDVKSEAKIDTVKLREELNSILTPKKIVSNFGPGYHNFYLALYSSPSGKISFQLNNFMWWMNSSNEHYKYYFENNNPNKLDDERNFTVKPNDLKAVIKKKDHITVGPIFNLEYDNTKNIFDAKPGLLNGKQVRSVKFFNINIVVDEKFKIIKPWIITEIDNSRFCPQIKNGLSEWEFNNRMKVVNYEELKTIKSKVVFPDAANKRGVTGRVLIKVFVDEKGNFAGYQMIKGLGFGCDEAVISALKSAKFTSNNLGQKSYLILPFEFGQNKGTIVDLTTKTFEYNPDPDVYNKLKVIIENNEKNTKEIKIGYNIYVYVDDELVFSNFCTRITKFKMQAGFFFGGKIFSKGTHNYAVYIDPEEITNDRNRENNILRGSFEVK